MTPYNPHCPGDTYKLAFAFSDLLYNSAKYIADVVSHEAGHTLGLSHDGSATTGYFQGQGSGTVGWAPIMGQGEHNHPQSRLGLSHFNFQHFSYFFCADHSLFFQKMLKEEQFAALFCQKNSYSFNIG